MNDWPAWLREVPGNEDAFVKLAEHVLAGNAVAFVGAGASAELYPLWEALLDKLTQEAVTRGLAPGDSARSWKEIAKKNARQAASLIRRALGEPAFAGVMSATFRRKLGPDGRPYTAAHSAIVRLPLRGIVTTNYDPGLLEARHEQRPEAATGYGIWKQDDACRAWLHANHCGPTDLPILFAHGTHDWAESIVLTAESYREAYGRGPYRRLFESLWGAGQLFFVGFSFSDPFLEFLAEQVVSEIGAAARHAALVGYEPYEHPTVENRRFFQDAYGVEPIFYPVRPNHNHSALIEALEALHPRTERPRIALAESSKTLPASAALKASWTHETTEDDRFTGRTSALVRLDRWAAEPQVRVIAVCGIGGLGKTSLVARWLKHEGGAARRPYRGLFFWSFYADRSVEGFFEALLGFGYDELGVEALAVGGRIRLVSAAIALLETAPLCLVLDGLEVIQERPGASAYGALLEHDLRELLDAACRRQKGLVILTSRFPFPDLFSHLGRGLRVHDLDALTPEEGAALLARLGVGGSEDERQAASMRLEGHPLLLRFFARAVQEQAKGDLSFRIALAFDVAGITGAEGLDEKMRHLLAFYEASLGPEQAVLIGLVSLFSTPVAAATLATLCGRLEVESLPRHADADDLARRLTPLVRDGLLLREPDAATPAFSAHPVVRDHFRGRLLGVAAKEAASLLTERPSEERIQRVEQIRPLVDAIQLLCDAGDLKAADEIYQRIGALDSDWFQWLPAPREGLECALAFVRDPERRSKSRRLLPNRRLGFYLNDVGLFATSCGESAFATEWFDLAVEHDRQIGNQLNLSIDLQNLSEHWVTLGSLELALTAAREAHALAIETNNNRRICNSLGYLATGLDLSGQIAEALAAFAQANALQNRLDPDAYDLYSMRGTRWAQLLARLGERERARRLSEANRNICRRNSWATDIARCDLLLGRLASNSAAALEQMRSAETTLRRGRQIRDLPDVLIGIADRHRLDGDFDEALTYAQEALELAAPRGHRLQQVDALVARGRVRLARAPEEALDDGEAALRIAEDCGYVWGERDAHDLLANAASALDNRDSACEHRAEADSLSECLRVPNGYVWPRAKCWRL